MRATIIMVLLSTLLVAADYSLLSLTPLPTGWNGVLQLSSPGPYGKDIEYLSLDVVFINDISLRVTLRDAVQPRWEIPADLLVGYTSPKTSPLQALYRFNISQYSPFTFFIQRISTNETIFDSSAIDLNFAPNYISFGSSLPLGHTVYGLGERIAPFRLESRTYTIETMDWGNPYYENLYGHHPVYMRMEDGGNAHLVMLWNSDAMDVVLADTSITYKVTGGIIDLFFFLGPAPLQLIQQYTDVIGKPFMPPLWSIGYHQCRDGYPTANYTLQVAKNYTLNRLPLDIMWKYATCMLHTMRNHTMNII